MNKKLYYLIKFFRRGEKKLYKIFIIRWWIILGIRKWTLFWLVFMYLYVDIFDIVLRYHLLRCFRFGLEGWKFYFVIEQTMAKFGTFWSVVYLFFFFIYLWGYFHLFVRIFSILKKF